MTCDYSCILCGVGVLSAPPSKSEWWLREYRIVYRDGKDASVSGVGSFNGDSSWKVPMDPLLRWDTVSGPKDQLEMPVMQQPAANGVHGFIIHDACWSLLQSASEPAGLSLERLVSVCESLPFPLWYNGVSWGHDYGGLHKLEVDDDYPWLERISRPSISGLWNMGGMSDPFAGLDFRAMLSTRTPRPPEKEMPLAKHAGDHFSRLPWELREMILVNLPTKSALDLRLASRSFLPLFSSFAFWSSRFEPDGERGFLFEVRESTTTLGDVEQLLHLHRLSRRSVATRGLLNRERVYGLARILLRVVGPSRVHSMPGRPTSSPDSNEWVRLAGQEQPSLSSEEWKAFERGCRPTTTVSVEAACGAVKVGIAVANMGIWDYVTGIRLVDQDGKEQGVGYTYNKNEIVCDVAALHGFRVAMGPGGVRALQVIGPERQASRWAGRVEGVPRSQRLAMNTPVSSTRVTLDGFKVTALAVRSNQSHVIAPPTIDFRDAAIWYPDIPPDDLVLNEASFTGQDPYSAGYQPLSWIHFGGPAGKSLVHIQGIQVQCSHNLHGLQFVYDETHGKRYSDKLGRCTEKSLSSGPLFPIDGAGGERINSVYVSTRHRHNPDADVLFLHEVLDCVMITTNRGRTNCIGKKADDREMVLLRAAHETTITGFYGHYDLKCGLASLGVISEKIVDP